MFQIYFLATFLLENKIYKSWGLCNDQFFEEACDLCGLTILEEVHERHEIEDNRHRNGIRSNLLVTQHKPSFINWWTFRRKYCGITTNSSTGTQQSHQWIKKGPRTKWWTQESVHIASNFRWVDWARPGPALNKKIKTSNFLIFWQLFWKNSSLFRLTSKISSFTMF